MKRPNIERMRRINYGSVDTSYLVSSVKLVEEYKSREIANKATGTQATPGSGGNTYQIEV